MRAAMRGWKVIHFHGIPADVFLLGRLVPCEHEVRHYVAVDRTGDLHCLELIAGDLKICIDELIYHWDQGEP